VSDHDTYRIDKRTFWAWQRQQEQQWLERMSKDGWTFVAWRPWSTYVFKRQSEPKPQKYLIERKWIVFPKSAPVEENYLNERLKEGWELVQPASAGWYFFSRPNS